MSQLSDSLKNHKIDARRIVLASKDLERRTREDLALVAKKAAIKAGKLEKDDAVMKQKPRSGRPVSLPQVEKAMRRHVETVEPEETLVNVAKLLRVSALNALVVVEKGTKDKVRAEHALSPDYCSELFLIASI